MTIYAFEPARMRGYEEPNGSFGVDASGSLGSFLEFPFRKDDGAKITLRQGIENPMHAKQHLDGRAKSIRTIKSARAEFTLDLETLDTKPGSAVTAAQGALGLCLKIWMGGQNLGVGTTVASTSTTTVINCTSAAGIPVGGIVGFATGTGGTLEMRKVISKATNAITLGLALSSIPANGSTVYSAATYYMASTDGGQTTFLQLAVERMFATARFLLLGGRLDSVSLALGPGGIGKMSMAWEFANWLHAAAAAANFAGTGALGFATYANNKTLAQKDSQLRQQTLGTSTFNSASILRAPEYSFSPNVKYVWARSPGGVETIEQCVRVAVDGPPVNGSFKIPFEDLTWFTARDASPPTDKAFVYQLGSSATDGGIMIEAPTAQVIDAQEIAVDGMDYQQVDWEGRLDESTSGSTTDLARSCFRIGLI